MHAHTLDEMFHFTWYTLDTRVPLSLPTLSRVRKDVNRDLCLYAKETYIYISMQKRPKTWLKTMISPIVPTLAPCYALLCLIACSSSKLRVLVLVSEV